MNDREPPSAIDRVALFQQVFDQRFQFMAILDPEGVVIEVNGAPLRRGFTREDFVGRHISATPNFASDPTWAFTWATRIAEVRLGGAPVAYEDVFVTPTGETRTADAVLSPVLGSDGSSVDLFVIEAEDTTERLQVELALRESERRFHDFAESLPVMALSTTASGECDFLNRRWLDYTGAAPGQHHGWDWIDAIHPEDRLGFGEVWMAALATGEAADGEYRVRRYDGAFRWFAIRLVPVFADEGQVTRWYGAATDVHEAHELRRSLEESEAQLTAALRAGGMARFSYDLARRRFTSDDLLHDLIDLPGSALASDGLEGWAEHVHPEDRGAWQRAMRRAFHPQTPDFAVQYRLLAGGRADQWVGSRGRVEFDGQGKPARIAGVVFVLPGSDVIDPRD